MNPCLARYAALTLCVLLPPLACTTNVPKSGAREGAYYRTHAQNYKDRVLAGCIANIIKNDEEARRDALGVYARLFEFTLYGQETDDANKEAKALTEQYLSRTYRDPHFTIETGIEVPFNFAKCIDLYHSKALEAHVRKHVIEPDRIDGGGD